MSAWASYSWAWVCLLYKERWWKEEDLLKMRRLEEERFQKLKKEEFPRMKSRKV